MAALNRPVTATYAVNETVRVDTQDNEDHTFCGIMFPIRAKMILPIEQIIIQSVAVRGHLGDISIWISNETTSKTSTTPETFSFKIVQKYWTKVYQNKHPSSPRSYQTMDLTKFYDKPVTLRPGQVRMIYIHSTLESDTAIVYDNSPATLLGNRSPPSTIRYEDDKIAIHSGKAHLSFVPFGQEPIWGWGNAWRDRREFVGQIQYGTIYKLWHPDRHSFFGKRYHAGTEALLMLQRRNTLFARLPDECIYYILNMCRWDWFDDTSRDMKARYRRRKSILRQQEFQQRLLEAQHRLSEQQQTSTAAYTASAGAKESHVECCKKNANGSDEGVAMDIDDENEHAMDDEGDDEDFVDDDEFDDEDNDDEEQDDEDEGNDDDDDDQNDDEDSNASSAWERAHGYRADFSRFVFQNVSSFEEEDDNDDGGNDDDDTEAGLHHHHPWFGRRAVRQVVLRALGGATPAGFIR